MTVGVKLTTNKVVQDNTANRTVIDTVPDGELWYFDEVYGYVNRDTQGGDQYHDYETTVGYTDPTGDGVLSQGGSTIRTQDEGGDKTGYNTNNQFGRYLYPGMEIVIVEVHDDDQINVKHEHEWTAVIRRII